MLTLIKREIEDNYVFFIGTLLITLIFYTIFAWQIYYGHSRDSILIATSLWNVLPMVLIFCGLGAAQMYWQPGIGLGATLARYLVFYAVTSLFWDLARMIGNMLLIAVGGAAVLRVLRRFQRRFAFTYAPLPRQEAGV